MNNMVFYNKLAKFRELQHAADAKNKYFAKIDNFYKDGTARYFYTRQEWEAYQEGTKQQKWQEDRKKKKEIEQKSGMTGYDEWKKEQDKIKKRQEAAEKTIANREAEIKKAQENFAENNRKALEQREQARKEAAEKTIANKEAAIKKSQDAWREQMEKQKAQERKEAAEKTLANRDAEIKKARENFAENNKKALENTNKEKIDKMKSEVDSLADEISKNIERCYENRGTAFTVDNDFVQYFKEELKRADPDFDGDLSSYLQPYWWGSSDDTHKQKANDVLNALKDKVNKEIDESTSKYLGYEKYLDSLKEKKEENRLKTINNQMEKARASLVDIYNGNAEKLDIDYRLQKVIEQKLKLADKDYDGNLYDYLSPSWFGFKKQDDAYDKTLEIIAEVEKELKDAESANNGNYSDFIKSISKVSIN